MHVNVADFILETLNYSLQYDEELCNGELYIMKGKGIKLILSSAAAHLSNCFNMFCVDRVYS